ncbi:MAG: arylsulfatase [Comamonadaceae bacterium BICA1-1]|nr:MAG: arylsulfatase [Comamonadaceae bacterium BICA1-1]
MAPRIALIHALALSVEPINAEFERAWPEALRMNLLDDSLSADLHASAGGLDGPMQQRFEMLADYAVFSGAQAILFTCSAFGPCIEAVAARHPALPVLKPNQAMIEEALRMGGRVGLIATFAPTLASMPTEFGPSVQVLSACVPAALHALQHGDPSTHDALVTEAALHLQAQGCDVIALAQFSMARAAPWVAQQVRVPVLTTPGSAVRALRQRLAGAVAA